MGGGGSEEQEEQFINFSILLRKQRDKIYPASKTRTKQSFLTFKIMHGGVSGDKSLLFPFGAGVNPDIFLISTYEIYKNTRA